MITKNHFLILFLFCISIVAAAQTREIKYYNLVVDSIQMPAFYKDTMTNVVAQLEAAYDDDREIYWVGFAKLNNQPQTFKVNNKIFDIKREDKLSFRLRISEYGNKKSETTVGVDNLYLYFEGTFSAISEGHRRFDFNNGKSRAVYYFRKDTDQSFYVILHWHLEPNKLL